MNASAGVARPAASVLGARALYFGSNAGATFGNYWAATGLHGNEASSLGSNIIFIIALYVGGSQYIHALLRANVGWYPTPPLAV